MKEFRLWEQKHDGEAAIDLEKAIQMTPDFLESYAFLADPYFRSGQLERSITAYKALSQKDSSLLAFLERKYPDIQESLSQSLRLSSGQAASPPIK